MATQITIKEQLNHYKKKRNQFLFFIISPLLIPILLYSLNFIFSFMNRSLLDTLILFLAIAYIFFITILRSRLSIYSMYLDYYLILDDEVGVQSLEKGFNPDQFLRTLGSKGYTRMRNTDSYLVYHYSKLPIKSHFEKKDTTLLIIYIKDETLDLYSEQLHNDLNTLYNEIESKSKPIGHQVTLFIKETSSLDPNIILEYQKIVNVQQGNRSLIQINIGIDSSQNKAYYLAPQKRYPNRMYYEAVQEIKRLIPFLKVGGPNES